MQDTLRPFRILGTGHALPKNVTTSKALDHKFGLNEGHIEKMSGVSTRHFCSKNDTAAQLGAQAIHKALAVADLHFDDIDCLVATSATMDQGLPSNAALILAEIQNKGRAIPAFDINASCLGFIAALDNLSWSLLHGRYQRILLVASDIASCGLNWDRLEESAIFGDGAAAAVVTGQLEHGCQSRILSSLLETYSAGAHHCEIPAGGSRFHPSRINQAFTPLTQFHMEGKKVFKLAAQQLPDFVHRLLDAAKVSLADIDCIVPHQASHLAMQHLRKKLNFPADKIIDIFAKHGNQVAASLPTALDIAIRSGRLSRGQKAMLIGTGAGLSIGGVILEF